MIMTAIEGGSRTPQDVMKRLKHTYYLPLVNHYLHVLAPVSVTSACGALALQAVVMHPLTDIITPEPHHCVGAAALIFAALMGALWLLMLRLRPHLRLSDTGAEFEGYGRRYQFTWDVAKGLSTVNCNHHFSGIYLTLHHAAQERPGGRRLPGAHTPFICAQQIPVGLFAPVGMSPATTIEDFKGTALGAALMHYAPQVFEPSACESHRYVVAEA